MRSLLLGCVAAMLALGAYLLLWDHFNAPPNAALAPANGVGAHPAAAINSSSDPTGAHTPRSTVTSSQPKGVASDAAKVVTEQHYKAALMAQECFDVRDFLEDIEGGKTKIPDETPSRDKLQQLINLRQTACAGITMRESSELIPIFAWRHRQVSKMLQPTMRDS